MKPAGKILLTVLFISSLSDPVRASSPFPAGQNCVAWKARKTMFLMKNVEAVGVNCKVQIQLETTAPSHVQVKVAIPLAEFKSGEEERDLEVRKLLREEAQPELLFLSDTITAKDWPLVLSGNYNSLKGVLKIGGKNFPVTLQLQKREANQALLGKIDVSLKSLDLVAPSVAGGLVAQVADQMELLMQVYPKESGF